MVHIYGMLCLQCTKESVGQRAEGKGHRAQGGGHRVADGGQRGERKEVCVWRLGGKAAIVSQCL
jgi:hypothetical protein